VGEESHGKTAVVLKTIAANQRLDSNFATLWVAAEHYDKEQAEALGVDNDRVLVVPTQDMVLGYEAMLDAAESRSVDFVVLDSYPAMSPPEEDEKGMGDLQVGLGARITGKFFRKAGVATRRSLLIEERPMCGVIINQYREKIGGFSPFGTPRTTPGGKAKNYAFYTRVEVKRDEWIKEKRPGKGEVNVGQTIKVKTLKNKQAPPQQVAMLDFYFADAPNLGFSRGQYDTGKEVVVLGILYDLIERNGAFFSFGDHRWRGREAMFQAIRDDGDVSRDLALAVRAQAMAVKQPRQFEDDVDASATAGKRTVRRRDVPAYGSPEFPELTDDQVKQLQETAR
jgi:recombination protein RecA